MVGCERRTLQQGSMLPDTTAACLEDVAASMDPLLDKSLAALQSSHSSFELWLSHVRQIAAHQLKRGLHLKPTNTKKIPN